MNKTRTMAGPHGCASGGQTIDLPDAEAKALIAGGHASPVRSEAIERAVVTPHETATKGHGK